MRPAVVCAIAVTFCAAVTLQPPRASSTIYSPPLDPAADNLPSLQPFFDSLPAGSTVSIPSGTWAIGGTLKAKKTVRIIGQNGATLKVTGAHGGGAVIEIGEYSSGTFAHDSVVSNLILDHSGTGPGVQNCLIVHGDRCTITKNTFRNAKHEGLVVHGDCASPLIEDNVAENCGLGNETYTSSTAGFNPHARGTILRRNKAIGCGLGFELSNSNVEVTECEASNPGTSIAGGPYTGFVIGNAVMGVYDVRLTRCRSIGYPVFAGAGNVNGRCTKISITNCYSDAGMFGVSGGLQNNIVSGQPGEGPDLDPAGSTFEGNTLIVRKAGADWFIYNVGPAPTENSKVFGREKWTCRRNRIINGIPASAEQQGAPLISVAGHVEADVSIVDNEFIDFDAAPSRGDIASFTNNASVAVPGKPNLLVSGNRAWKKPAGIYAAMQRPVDIKIEGAP
jgi:hypothetical protein